MGYTTTYRIKNNARAVRRAATGRGHGTISATLIDVNAIYDDWLLHVDVAQDERNVAATLRRVELRAAEARARIAAKPPRIKKGKKTRKPKK